MDRPCAANAACWLLATLPLFLATSAASPEEPAMYCDGPRVLLFWPVDGAPRTVHQVKRNTAYVKSSLGDNCVAVFLAHYKGDGGQFGQDWYSENVVGNISGPGYKFKFMHDAYNKAQLEDEWETKYDYVWGLDTDVDLTGTNLTKLFQLVKQSKALITGPTFTGPGVNQKSPKAAMLKQQSLVPSGDSLLETAEGDVDSLSIWRFQRPDPNCDYRHTDFVELTAPILSIMALPMIFNDCRGCIHDESDWGLDMVWCKFLASEAKSGSSCALIDAAPVKHLNWKQASPSDAFYAANNDVHKTHRRFWTHMKTLSCVSNGTPAMQDDLSGGARLVRKESG